LREWLVDDSSNSVGDFTADSSRGVCRVAYGDLSRWATHQTEVVKKPARGSEIRPNGSRRTLESSLAGLNR
jgi:hypothetical protein